MTKSSGMRGGRSHNGYGRLRQMRTDKHLQPIRDQCSRQATPERGNTLLGTIRKRMGKSEQKLVRK